MAKRYPVPRIYTNNSSVSNLSTTDSIISVPIFVGFTEKTTHSNTSLLYKPIRLHSLNEFILLYGTVSNTDLHWNETTQNYTFADALTYHLYYALQMYFDNGGKVCYVVSTGVYRKNLDNRLALARFEKAWQNIIQEPEPNILVWADAHLCGEILSYQAYQLALRYGNTKKDWLVLIDLYSKNYTDQYKDLRESFESHIGHEGLKYGATYYPYLQTEYDLLHDESKCRVRVNNAWFYLKLPVNSPDLSRSLYHVNRNLYDRAKVFMADKKVILPPTSAVAGVYCQKKVWKAPANIALQSVEKPMVKIDDFVQEIMNVNPSGKSVNAIRSFTGKGVLVWGARTLQGNDNEWRYISTVRLCGAIEKIIKKIVTRFSGSPNEQQTWVAIKTSVSYFLDGLWRQGALVGVKPAEAFFCRIGLGRTMTEQDVLDNRVIVEVGLSVIRPAEFLMLRIKKYL